MMEPCARTAATECARPVILRRGETVSRVRCRQCRPCLLARRRYWTIAAIHQLEKAASEGCRTWFGTLTFDPLVQDELRECAIESNLVQDWDDIEAVERRKLLIHEAVQELQRYWKRLRKAGLSFKYLAAIESSQAGTPHAHFLLHETEAGRPVLKRELDAGWGRGFTSIRLAKGASPQATVHYVCKGLSEQNDQRVLASRGYRPASKHEGLSPPLL